ncbi:hypothetical protein SERLADRAFT_433468 [Serpula lacrymans var. lacrymans S7.9]|uniref:Uncharacterized protein n=1 Tax=Serpula lacrymans var. lacrymans (strain S7.9) TaxID=578457 RepID=F8NIE0_SERL9|nr:uncharacterized protein SERLADRAFT_433468 [Serpula lacrymans var. lacrymans S7.9]EGO29489.1 hypothetical protein SERLADRAFT_433468 [Serpula lacrymans var. lacrymans S7.9]
MGGTFIELTFRAQGNTQIPVGSTSSREDPGNVSTHCLGPPLSGVAVVVVVVEEEEEEEEEEERGGGGGGGGVEVRWFEQVRAIAKMPKPQTKPNLNLGFGLVVLSFELLAQPELWHP